MALDIAAIQTAITEVLDGTFTGVRDVAANTYQAANITADASHAMALTRPTFEIEIKSSARHGAAPAYVAGSRSLETFDIDVGFVYALPSTIQTSERYEVQAAMIQNANLAIQALTFPMNLATTAAAASTGIISGMLFGPGGSGYPHAEHDRDWATSIGRTTIHASAVVDVTQETS